MLFPSWFQIVTRIVFLFWEAREKDLALCKPLWTCISEEMYMELVNQWAFPARKTKKDQQLLHFVGSIGNSLSCREHANKSNRRKSCQSHGLVNNVNIAHLPKGRGVSSTYFLLYLPHESLRKNWLRVVDCETTISVQHVGSTSLFPALCAVRVTVSAQTSAVY